MKELFSQCGIEINDVQINQFERYFNLLCEYNEKFNLTAITDRKEVIIKHFIDCACFAGFFDKNASVLDVGSGAGFPGAVLAVLRPDLKITLLDSIGKKTDFLRILAENLNLNVEIINVRAEDFTQGKERFDVVTSRAVAPLSTLLEYCAYLAKTGGKLAFYKGGNIDEKWQNTASVLGLKRQKDLLFSLPESHGERRLVIFDKLLTTPEKYPRRSNKPRKSPLF